MAAFLAGRLPFPGIADVVERVLERLEAGLVESLEQVLETDRRARAAGRASGGGGRVSYFVAHRSGC